MKKYKVTICPPLGDTCTSFVITCNNMTTENGNVIYADGIRIEYGDSESLKYGASIDVVELP